MLKEAAEKMVKKSDDLMDKVMKQTMGAYTIRNMQTEELGIIQDALDYMEMYNQILVEQATIIDDLNRKMDILLKRSERA